MPVEERELVSSGYLTPAEAEPLIESAGRIGWDKHRDRTLLLLAFGTKAMGVFKIGHPQTVYRLHPTDHPGARARTEAYVSGACFQAMGVFESLS